MTDSHEYHTYTGPVEPLNEPVKEETVKTEETVAVTEQEDNPMLSALKGFMDSAKEFGSLNKRVKMLEERVASLTDQLSKVTTERDSLRAENANMRDEIRSLKDEQAYKSEVLERTRKQVTDWSRRYDQEHSAFNTLKDEHEHVKDDRDLGVLEIADLKRDLQIEKDAKETVQKDYDTHRDQWYDQEAKLQEQIDRVTVERDRFRDLFDRARSHAAQTMALGQGHN